MNISIDEFYILLGAKEAELYALRRDLAALQAKLAELEPKPVAPLA